MKILDRYVLWSFIKNYLISLMVLLGLYVVLDMVFNFDELAEGPQKAQLAATVRDVSKTRGQLRGILTIVRGETAPAGTEFKIAGLEGRTIATMRVEDAVGHDVAGPLELSGEELPRRGMTAVAPGPAASTFAVFGSIISYYYHQSFLFFVQLSGIIPVVAAAFTLIRMSRFNELSAILAAGVPLLRVSMPIVYAGVVINFLLLPLTQEVVIPRMIPELTRKHDELQTTGVKTFPIRAMQDVHSSLLNVGRYTPPDAEKPAHLEVIDIIERDKELKPVAHITADSAEYDAQNDQWILVNGQRITGLGANETRSDPVPLAVWKSDISPEEIALYRESDVVELLSTQKINALLKREQSYGKANLQRVKHFRWSQLLINIVLLLLAIPCVLTREPGTLKTDLLKCVVLSGLCLASIFVAHQIAGNPPPDERLRQQWPLIMAWIPIFVFLPLAIFLLEPEAREEDVRG